MNVGVEMDATEMQYAIIPGAAIHAHADKVLKEVVALARVSNQYSVMKTKVFFII